MRGLGAGDWGLETGNPLTALAPCPRMVYKPWSVNNLSNRIKFMSEDTKKILYSMVGVINNYNGKPIFKDISLS